MNNSTSSLVILFFLLIFTCLCEIIAKTDNANTKLYAVYLGHKPHNDHELITDSHHDLLGQVVGSKEEAKKLMVYSYRHGFSGFAAKLTDSQVKEIGGRNFIKKLPGVVRIIPNSLYKTHTSRSWNFLGLSKQDSNSLMNKTNQGDGIIIGILDTGIGWGNNSEVFNDKGLGPIPSRWKGSCKEEDNFSASKYCNRKIIGARWYMKGMMEANDLNQTMAERLHKLSALDDNGHGTHVAYTAAGSYVNNVKYYDLNMGTTHGGAPLARLAIYKVGWKSKGTSISNIDVLAAIDDAIKDGVDILSASLGGSINVADIDQSNVLGMGSFHAVSHGIPFIAASGNSGPDSSTVDNNSPWLISVASSNSDRDIVTPLTLGNNKTILAAGLTKGMQQAFAPLVTFINITNNQDPIIKYGRTEILEGTNTYIKVPSFSSRGPNTFAPEILKPDIAAPGVNILAAVPPHLLKGYNGFNIMSGTSMSAPHVSGIVALLKAAHPNWSPAAIKSALVTTAWNEDTYATEIFSEGNGAKLADPFDFGGGICNPNGAADPGLIYDMDRNDYLNYFCSMGYSNDRIYNATTYHSDAKKSSSSAGIVCPKEVPSRLDMNLPSISIQNLKDSVTIKRTVTNVGNANSLYKLVVKPPRNTAIKVTPDVLKFNAKTTKISFEVKITSTNQRRSKFTFGSLAWSDGKHFVRIPIAVRKQ
ncbi:subtilisin-like protease SBT3.6 isoform X3 [Capsicum annuum]|uniref:subtilisin-like protease SBT3.6 isoform X3 n=1 Tax=Capsicum annuum TaxID=4072 RepID=UPI001FB0685B|nr:subtilisin-like protease SBT3.6 isoform X3 [Capsicum annuum]